MKGSAVLLLVVLLGCGGKTQGADAATDAASGAAGTGGVGGQAGTGEGGRGGTGESCVREGMACSATGPACCPPLVCAGGCVTPPSQDGGSACVGSAGFGCLYGGCRGDVGAAPVCMNGSWGCPAGAIDTRSCGGCIGNPPPNWECGDGGWFLPDAIGAE